jgi:DNA polymerase (family X)
MDNASLARNLNAVADLLEIGNANRFRIRAYRNAARTVETQTVPLARRVEAGEDLTDLSGIGKEMAAHLTEMVETGELSLLAELLEDIPHGVVELMRLPRLGPKRARQLYDALGVASVDELEQAAQDGRVAAVPGFGLKTEAKILASIEQYRKHRERLRLVDAERHVTPLLDYLRETPGLDEVEVAGSFRRRRETVRDLDLLGIVRDPSDAPNVMERFLAYPQVTRVEMSGDTRASVVLGSGLQVDFRLLPPRSYGAALVYFTGSKEHNVRLRQRALSKGLTVSEYGVFPDRDAGHTPEAGEPLAGATEEEVYEALGLPWIPPELREDRGEIDAAARGELPTLVTVADLKGDLQMHSTWSDGKNTIEEMLKACAARGYEYFALTDHSKALPMTGGLDAVRLAEQWREIDEIAARHPEIRFLKSQEIDILADGSLDQDEDMLEGLDVVVVSIHSRFDLPEAEQTERVIRALAHPRVDVLAHPTGRIINRRPPIALDIDAVLQAAAEHRVAVELNASPARLDLKDTHLLRARELGVPVVISTDAHSTKGLDDMRWGVEQARRAWLEPRHVLNTWPVEELLGWLQGG